MQEMSKKFGKVHDNKILFRNRVSIELIEGQNMDKDFEAGRIDVSTHPFTIEFENILRRSKEF